MKKKIYIYIGIAVLVLAIAFAVAYNYAKGMGKKVRFEPLRLRKFQLDTTNILAAKVMFELVLKGFNDNNVSINIARIRGDIYSNKGRLVSNFLAENGVLEKKSDTEFPVKCEAYILNIGLTAADFLSGTGFSTLVPLTVKGVADIKVLGFIKIGVPFEQQVGTT